MNRYHLETKDLIWTRHERLINEEGVVKKTTWRKKNKVWGLKSAIIIIAVVS